NGFVLEGRVGTTVTFWTFYEAQPFCSLQMPIYCFGVGNTAAIDRPPITGRRAFVSSLAGVGATSLGIGNADLVCQNDAAAIGGTFEALLATTGSTPISRFSLAGSNWVRVDGFPIAKSTAAFASGTFDAAIDRLVDGTPISISDRGVWT